MLSSLDKQYAVGGRASLTSLCSIILWAGLGVSANTALVGAAASSDPVFKALLLDGRPGSGRLIALGPGAVKLESAEGAAHDLPFDRVVKLTREPAVSLPAPEHSHVILPDGDCVMRVGLGSSTETSLDVQSDSLGKLTIPLDGIEGLIFAGGSQASELDSLWDRVRAESRSSEVVWLANGDRLAGGFLGLDETKIKIQVNGKPVEVARAGVVALGFDPGLVSYPRPKSDFLEVGLKDGSRLGVTEARLDDGMILATTRFGQAIKFSLNELTRVHVRSPSVAYLSEPQAGSCSLCSLYRADARISRRSYGRWPHFPSRRSNVRPRAGHAEPHAAGLSSRAA